MKVYLVYNLEEYEDKDIVSVCATYELALEKEYEVYKDKHEELYKDLMHDPHWKWVFENKLYYNSYKDFDDFCENFPHEIEEWEVEE